MEATRDLYFTRDIGEWTDCSRAPVAQKIGVKSAVCFPLIVEGDVIGTMDFFATETLDPSAGRLEALRQGEDQALAARREAVPAVEAMVDEAVAGWLRRRAEFRLSGSLRRLHEQADSLTQELAGELAAPGVSASDAELMVRRPVRRLLHEVTSELRLLEAGAA